MAFPYGIVLIGGGLLLGGYFLFATEAGQDFLDSIFNKTSATKKWDDPFKYLTPATAGAWNPKSKMYKDIQKRIGNRYQTIDELYE